MLSQPRTDNDFVKGEVEEAHDAIIALFRCVEKLGKSPTNAAIFTFARSLGYKFRDVDAKVKLAKFRAARHQPGTGAAPQRTDAAPERHLELSTRAPERPIAAPDGHQPGTNAAGATCARVIPDPIPDPLTLVPISIVEKRKAGKRVKVAIEVPSAFDDASLEAATVAFMAVAADKKLGRLKGTLTDLQARGFREQIAAKVALFGADAMIYGLREVAARGIDNVNYAAKVAADYDPQKATKVTPIRRPQNTSYLGGGDWERPLAEIIGNEENAWPITPVRSIGSGPNDLKSRVG